jgi:hypothetical protein
MYPHGAHEATTTTSIVVGRASSAFERTWTVVSAGPASATFADVVSSVIALKRTPKAFF